MFKLAGRGSDLPKEKTMLLEETGKGAVWGPLADPPLDELLDAPVSEHTQTMLELQSLQITLLLVMVRQEPSSELVFFVVERDLVPP